MDHSLPNKSVNLVCLQSLRILNGPEMLPIDKKMAIN